MLGRHVGDLEGVGAPARVDDLDLGEVRERAPQQRDEERQAELEQEARRDALAAQRRPVPHLEQVVLAHEVLDARLQRHVRAAAGGGGGRTPGAGRGAGARRPPPARTAVGGASASCLSLLSVNHTKINIKNTIFFCAKPFLLLCL